MEEQMNVYARLLAIQNELKAPKSQYNSFGKYKYRNAEDILEAVKPLCKTYGVVLTLSDSIEHVAGRHYVKATATLINIDKVTETVSATAYAREEETKKGMDGSQVTGAASSYARKYALNGLFDIDDTKDSDTTNTGNDNTGAVNQIYCSDCRRAITDSVANDGRRWSAADIMQYTQKRHGRALCVECNRNADRQRTAG